MPESSEGEGSWYEWMVQISASLPGTDFDRSWEVPVFNNAGPQVARARIRPRRLDVDPQALSDSLVRIRETGAGLELYYPYLRHPGMALGTLLTGAGFIGFAWLFHVASGEGGMTRLFIGLFSLAGVPIIVWGLYMLGNSLHVTAGRQGLTAVRGIFGLRFARHIASDEITAIEKSIGMQTRQGNRARAYYRIQVQTRDGHNIVAGSGIPGASRVDDIMLRLRKALDVADLTIAAENSRGSIE